MAHQWLVALVFALTGVLGAEYDFTVEIRPGKYECYFQPVTEDKHKILEIDYQVVDGGDLDVNFMVIFGADILAQDNKKTDGHHKIPINTLGDYQFCFDNTFSYQSRKVVYFEVFLTDAEGNIDDDDLAKMARKDMEMGQRIQEIGMTLANYAALTNRVKQNLNKIEWYQSNLRSYEHRDMSIMNANQSRVTFWSTAGTLAMIFASVVQVYLIRSLFEDNSRVGRALRRTGH